MECMVFFLLFVFLIVDGIGDPIWSLGHSVVDTGLTAFCTWVTGWHDAYKGPPALNFGHERTPRIPLTRVFAPTIVASTDHFVIDYDVDALVSMPSLTLSIFNHRNIHNLKNYKKKWWNKYWFMSIKFFLTKVQTITQLCTTSSIINNKYIVPCIFTRFISCHHHILNSNFIKIRRTILVVWPDVIIRFNS